jgi:hypothetical protein
VNGFIENKLMTKYKYSAEQICNILKALENQGRGDSEFYKKHKINATTVDVWRKKFTRLSVERIEHLRQIEEEHRQLILENERLEQRSQAAIEFFKNEFPDVKVRRAYAKKLFEQGLIGQTEVCKLFSIKWNSFVHNSR